MDPAATRTGEEQTLEGEFGSSLSAMVIMLNHVDAPKTPLRVLQMGDPALLRALQR